MEDRVPEEHAPFVRRDLYGTMGMKRQNVFERARLALMCVTLLPLRFITCVSIVALYYLVCVAFPESERVNRLALSTLSRAVLFVTGFLSIKVDRAESASEVEVGGIVCNHVSWADILIICWLFAPSFVARRATMDTPLIGRISVAMDCLFVDRPEDNPGGGRGTAQALRDRMALAHRAKSSRPVAVFAEGTTTNGDYLLPFKSGAFLARVPVKIALVRYRGKRVSPAWESISGLRHVILMLCEPWHRAQVTIFDFHPKPGETAEGYRERARAKVLEVSGLRPSSATFQDKRAYHRLLLSAPSGNKTE